MTDVIVYAKKYDNGRRGKIVAIETNHVLIEFTSEKDRWGEVLRQWYSKALIEPKELIEVKR
jgi:hypothetical protein